MGLQFLIYDVIFGLLGWVIYGLALALSVGLGQCLWALPFPYSAMLLPLCGLVFILGVIFQVGIVRLCLPRLKAGHYSVPQSKAFLIWLALFSLNRLISLQPLKNIILYSATLRFLAFRASGAKIAFDTSISADVDLGDLSFIQIGSGSLIGAYTAITGHLMTTQKIYFGQVKIGKNVNIGALCRIAAGVSIGDDTSIGAECTLAPLVIIGKGCTIKNSCFVPSGTRLADGDTFPFEEDAD